MNAAAVHKATAIGLMGYFMIAGVKKSLTQIQDSVGRTQRDLDFTLRTPILRQDEIGALARAFDQQKRPVRHLPLQLFP